MNKINLENKINSLASFLSEKFGLSNIVIQNLRESSDNFVFLVSSNECKYVARFSKKTTEQDILFELEFISNLRKNAFPAPEIIPTTSGDNFCLYEGSFICVLFRFYEGKSVDKNIPNMMDYVTLAGENLGNLHTLTENMALTMPRNRTILSELERVIEKKGVFISEFNNGELFIKEVEWAISFSRQENDSKKGIIHNDYRIHNLLFKNSSTIKVILDFDWSCPGPLIKDVALALVEWSFFDGDRQPKLDIMETFLNAYNKTAPLKLSLDKRLYDWMKFSCLSDTATYFCDRIGSENLKKDINKSYMYQKYKYFYQLSNNN